MWKHDVSDLIEAVIRGARAATAAAQPADQPQPGALSISVVINLPAAPALAPEFAIPER
jgi:hypothetical protein